MGHTSSIYLPALCFGGINGFVTVSVNGFPKLDYNPEIQFSNLSIFGKEYNINDFVSIENSRKNITLNYEQNFSLYRLLL